MTILLIALGGAIGAVARYLTVQAVQRRHESTFPWGTLTVNVVGSFVLALLTAAVHRIDPLVAAGLGVGFCGALTTYSTLAYETLQLAEDGARYLSVANAVASVVAGLGAASIGWALGSIAG